MHDVPVSADYCSAGHCRNQTPQTNSNTSYTTDTLEYTIILHHCTPRTPVSLGRITVGTTIRINSTTTTTTTATITAAATTPGVKTKLECLFLHHRSYTSQFLRLSDRLQQRLFFPQHLATDLRYTWVTKAALALSNASLPSFSPTETRADEEQRGLTSVPTGRDNGNSGSCRANHPSTSGLSYFLRHSFTA